MAKSGEKGHVGFVGELVKFFSTRVEPSLVSSGLYNPGDTEGKAHVTLPSRTPNEVRESYGYDPPEVEVLSLHGPGPYPLSTPPAPPSPPPTETKQRVSPDYPVIAAAMDTEQARQAVTDHANWLENLADPGPPTYGKIDLETVLPKVRAAVESVVAYHKAAANLKSEVLKAHNEHAFIVTHWRGRAERAERTNTTQAAELASLRTDYKALLRTKEELQQTISVKDHTIYEVRGQLVDTTHSLDRLNTQVAALQQEVSSLRQQLADARAENLPRIKVARTLRRIPLENT